METGECIQIFVQNNLIYRKGEAEFFIVDIDVLLCISQQVCQNRVSGFHHIAVVGILCPEAGEYLFFCGKDSLGEEGFVNGLRQIAGDSVSDSRLSILKIGEAAQNDKFSLISVLPCLLYQLYA